MKSLVESGVRRLCAAGLLLTSFGAAVPAHAFPPYRSTDAGTVDTGGLVLDAWASKEFGVW